MAGGLWKQSECCDGKWLKMSEKIAENEKEAVKTRVLDSKNGRKARFELFSLDICSWKRIGELFFSVLRKLLNVHDVGNRTWTILCLTTRMGHGGGALLAADCWRRRNARHYHYYHGAFSILPKRNKMIEKGRRHLLLVVTWTKKARRTPKEEGRSAAVPNLQPNNILSD